MARNNLNLCKDFKLDRVNGFQVKEPVRHQSLLTSLLYVGFGMTIPVAVWKTGLGHAAIDVIVFCLRQG